MVSVLGQRFALVSTRLPGDAGLPGRPIPVVAPVCGGLVPFGKGLGCCVARKGMTLTIS